MLKEVDLSALKVGDYIHDIGRNWFDHPFPTNSFKLKSAAQINRLRSAGITRIVIDTDKGDAPISEEKMNTLAANDELVSNHAGSADPAEDSAWVPLERELGRAFAIKKQATRMVVKAMDRVRKGEKIQIEALNSVVEDIVASIFRNPNALIGLMRIRLKDKYTYEHSVSMSVLLTAFGLHLNQSKGDLVQLGLGGLLMDIGKTKIPLGILTKAGKLTPREETLVHRHVEYGREILQSCDDMPSIAMDVVSDHHERFNGTGYPRGKRGEEISFYGMMAAIVDVYDAISTDRAYRGSISPHAALKTLIRGKNTAFHAELVYSFVHCVGVYPIGTLVQLSDGRFGVVLEPGSISEGRSLQPRVRVIYDSRTHQQLAPLDLNLAQQQGEKIITSIGAQEPEKWKLEPWRFLDHAQV